jgi:hypothetical protein
MAHREPETLSVDHGSQLAPGNPHSPSGSSMAIDFSRAVLEEEARDRRMRLRAIWSSQRRALSCYHRRRMQASAMAPDSTVISASVPWPSH